MKKRRTVTALRRVRMSRCMSQMELAEKMGKTSATVSFLEKYGIKRVSTAMKYAEQLRCRPEELLEFSRA